MSKVYLICGRICSGKTVYAEKLVREKKAVLLSVDEITLSIFDSHLGSDHEAVTDKVQKMLYEKSLKILQTGIDVVLDWGFWRLADREYAREFYRANNIPFEFHYIDVSEDLLKLNMKLRNRDVIDKKHQAYYVDENLAKKCSEIFEKPVDCEMDKIISSNFPIPTEIFKLVENKSYSFDSVGMSGSSVIIFDDRVLKISIGEDAFKSEAAIMSWLNGRVPVPKVICHVVENGMSYLLMTRIEGIMSCDEYYMERPKELLGLLASALKMLWDVDIEDCPVSQNLDRELNEAEERVKLGLVDVNAVEPETFGPGGFESPAALLEWLKANKPECSKVLSHGDFCLPNIFCNNGSISGLIDLGDCGIGDKWRDISLCYRSLKHNFDGSFGGKVYPDFKPDMLFEALGIEPDWDRLKYWILLDELF